MRYLKIDRLEGRKIFLLIKTVGKHYSHECLILAVEYPDSIIILHNYNTTYNITNYFPWFNIVQNKPQPCHYCAG